MNSGPSLTQMFDARIEKEAARDVLRPSEIVGQLVGALFGVLFAVYFLVLHGSNTGFFTSGFDTFDAILFFGIAFLGIVPGLLRAIIGKKNAVRPLDVVFSVLMLIASIWFLSTFPFDFSHIADSLPSNLQFLLSWISDWLAKWVLVIAIIVNVFLIPYTALLFLAVRSKLSTAGRQK